MFVDADDLLARAAELHARGRAEEAEDLCRELAARGTPLSDPATHRHTFLAQVGDATAVHLWMNRISDKQHYDRGIMRPVPGTTWWVLTLELAPTLRATYGFACTRRGEAAPTGAARGRRHHGGHLPDPWSRFPRCGALSQFIGALAEPCPEFEGAEAGEDLPRGTVEQSVIDCLGQRPVWLYTPHRDATHPDATHPNAPHADAAPLPLLILLDGEQWFTVHDLPRALDRARAAGTLPPLRVLGIGSLGPEDRRTHLAGNPAFAESLLTTALPWATPDPTDIIVTGQSLTALSALTLAAHHPTRIRAAIAQSPSLWWTPHRPATPADLGSTAVDWATTLLADASTAPHLPALHLTVGLREQPLLPRVHLCALHAARAGWPATVTVHDGGHDYAWWRHGLITELRKILP